MIAKPIASSAQGWKTPQAAAFGFSLTAAWAAIGVLWIMTPLSYAYVLYNLITLHPSLQTYQPFYYFSSPSHYSRGLLALYSILLIYTTCEVPFSIYYRYLAYEANKRKPADGQFTRKFLRSVFVRSLENGMILEEELEEEVTGHPIQDEEDQEDTILTLSKSHTYEMRNRKSDSNSSSETLKVPIKVSKVKKSTASLRTPIPLTPTDPRALDFQSYLAGWFHNCPFSSIQLDDITSWLSWSLYGCTTAELLAERVAWREGGRKEVFIEGVRDSDDWGEGEGEGVEEDRLGLVEHCVELVEKRAGGIKFKEGSNPEVEVIRLTLDPVKVIGRPLVLYLFVYCLQKVIIANNQLHGFRNYKQGRTQYLMRIPKGWTPERDGPESKRPLLFCHGLGMGLAQYATLANHLSTSPKLKDRPIIILIQPSISMSFFDAEYLHPPDKKSLTRDLVEVAKKWRFDESGLTVLSHSNGTIVHGWLVKACPELVVRSCFVDGVCFCLWEPFVCYNFLYSTARTPIEYLMRFFVSRELGVALMLQRAFSWSDNLLFPSSIPNLHSPYHSAFFLAGKDSILNAGRIRTYLKRHGIKEVGKGLNVGENRGGLKVHNGKAHGESMIGSGRAFHQIMAWVEGDLEGEGDGAIGDSTGSSDL